MQSGSRILIVGGGIAGLTAAIALRRAGIEVEVVEQNPAWTVYGVGIIQLANALRALNTIGLADQCVAAGHPLPSVRLYDGQGHLVVEIPQPPLAGPQFPPGNALTRSRLHAILQRAVRESGANIRLGLTVAELADTDTGVDVTFTDGTTGHYDLVVGADGIRSLVRRMVFGPEYQPTYVGQMCWRCNVPRPPEVETAWLFEGGPIGRGGFIPLAQDLMYILLVETTNTASPPRVPDDRLVETLRERLGPFGGPLAEVRDRDITPSSDVVLRPFETLLMPPPWYRGHVVLIGDAAHSMTAHIAQGAALAVEDAIVLAEEIAGRDGGTGSDGGTALQEALDRFMQRRYERCKALVEISSEISRGERERVDVDVPGLTRRSFEVAAAPI
ncbi:MAG: FAD-dependent oxidoreductase [Chloroflexi bacterium]|nr:FAD-dependent oxidoreductase [Chloroflexota bacterium]